MTARNVPTANQARSRPREVLLRVGLGLAAACAIANAMGELPAGFDGSAWDPVVVIIAVLGGGILIATGVCFFFAWRGGRRTARAIAILVLVGCLPSLPAFLLPAEETSAEGGGVLLASIGLLIAIAAFALITAGLPRRASRA